jgi:hypothetical protein
MKFLSIFLLPLLQPLLVACVNVGWELGHGARQGAKNAARLAGSAAILQATRLLAHHRYVQQRGSLRGQAGQTAASAGDMAASRAAR